ncbi:probable fructose-2,6-bisphosphatase TIGAR A, partial [Cyprinodon tularosa]|uniref:probable fructose-2,6-bisphosphatase TIGAR A n=1 Tax=Cyprinodon tularosa TaxID=77115 RepID=UPI0018E28D28
NAPLCYPQNGRAALWTHACSTTAEKIMQQNRSCLGLRMVCDPLLKEKSFGIAEGGRVVDFKEMARAAGQSFPDFTPPEGETQQQVKERVQKFMEKMVYQIGTEHWPNGGQNAASAAASPESPSAAGEADDGVRSIPIHALVVTHGADMRVAVRYFVEEMFCSLPPSCNEQLMFSLSPNTGICRFTLSIAKEGSRFIVLGMQCFFIHRTDHIKQ